MGALRDDRPSPQGGEILGLPDGGARWIRRREEFYVRALGPMREPAVYHWDDDGDPHIDVYVIGRSRKRPYETLVTGGLADRPQPGLAVPSARPRRVEVLVRMKRAEDWAAQILREIACLPFAFGLSLDEGGMIRGSRPIVPGSVLEHVVLARADEEAGLAGFLVEGEEVAFLRPVFITADEFDLGLAVGPDRLLALLARHGADSVLDARRRPVA